MGTENIIMPRWKYATEVSGFPYQRVNEVSDTQKYAIGARYHEAISGRVFKYAKSNGICLASRGAASYSAIEQGITYTSLSGSQQIGDRQVTFDASTHDILLEDELQGGLLSIALGTDLRQDLIVSGNDAAAADAAVTVHFDEPLTTATDTDMSGYVSPNPYYRLRTGDEATFTYPIVGVPGAYVSATGKFFWAQTWGPCYVSSGASWTNRTQYENMGVWHYNGQICNPDFGQPVTHVYCQIAGFALTKGTNVIPGRRTIQLMISP